MNEILDDLLSPALLERLDRLAGDLRESYANNTPFPHAVMDNFLPDDILGKALDAFPKPADLEWLKFEGNTEKKLAFPTVDKLPTPLRDVLYFLNSSSVMRILEKLTSIEGLLPDPHYYGGGLHQIERDGHLEVHVDFNMLPKLRIMRRLNLLLYLNKDWKEEYGGHLELWNADMTRAEKRILPVFNRCVVFSTIENSYHGHPHPLACPEGFSRKSIATYYYTAPEFDPVAAGWRSTQFQARPDPIPAWKSAAKQIVPPIALTAYRKLRGR